MQKKQLTLDDSNTQPRDNADLPVSFDVATLKLRECALHEPGQSFEQDQEVVALESELLFIQESLLEKAIETQIEHESDFLAIKKLWQSAVNLKHDNDLSLVDKLALSLFQYVEQNSLKG